jgi:signal transduction histidine kinase
MLLTGYLAAGWLRQLFQMRGVGYAHILTDPTMRAETREDAIRLQERLHLLAQLHDGPVQTATRLAIHLDQVPNVGPEVTGEVKQLIAEMRQLIRLGTLVPVSPEEWVTTLQEVAGEIERVYGIAVPIVVQGESPAQAPREVVNALFFVAREALYNAARHARATECVVTITTSDDMIQLQVRDNGVGFDPHSVEAIRRASFGLQSMRSRVEALGGTFVVASSRESGTTLRASIPLPLAGGS